MKFIWADRKRPRQVGDAFAIILILSISLGMPISVFHPVATAATLQKELSRELSEQEAEQIRSIAEAQFEIVKILIKQGRFDRVLP
jgi:hypothetical protein